MMSRRAPLRLLVTIGGSGVAALMQVAFVPVYIHVLGMEAWGLVGFYLTLQAALQVLDFGLSPTVSRELARFSAQPDKAADARDLVRTLEVGYWAIGLAIGLAVTLAAPWLALHWLRPASLPTKVVVQGVTLAGVVLALQWPLSFYQGGLVGLQRQVALSVLQVSIATLRATGAVAVLWFVSPTILAYLIWQAVVGAIHVTVTTGLLWRSLPAAPAKPTVRLGLVRQVARFAAGMTGIGVSALLLTQADKLVLSRLVPLDTFGQYILAGTVAAGLTIVITPIFNIVFPHLSMLAGSVTSSALAVHYHRASQAMAVLLTPLALLIVFFADDLLRLWTGNATLAAQVAPMARLLVAGTALNGLMHLPYALQLAHGWTGIGLRINLLLIVMLVPAVAVAALRFGAVGAAATWCGLNILYMVVAVPLTHRRLVRGHAGRWFVHDVLIPAAGAAAVIGVAKLAAPAPLSLGVAAVLLPGSLALALVVAGLSAGQVRSAVRSELIRVLWRPTGGEV
jgi:O-antigen/teichoic acid export membrane protein